LTATLTDVMDARRRVLDLTVREGASVIIVDSPPGAGKTRLVEDVVSAATSNSLRVAVLTPRAEQSFDLVRRLVASFPGIPIQVLQSAHRSYPPDLQNDSRVPLPVNDPANLSDGPGVVIGTASKFYHAIHCFTRGSKEFDLIICDEAYQLTFKDIEPFPAISGQLLLVGDPGQLPPVVTVDTTRFDAAPYKVHWPAPREVLRQHPDVPVVKLPATYRFSDDSVQLIQPAFYPSLPFRSAVTERERAVSFSARGFRDPIDSALDLVASGATIVAITLPPKDFAFDSADEDVATTIAHICARAIERGVRWGTRQLNDGDIACADAHVASGAAVRQALRRLHVSSELLVDTPEILQGLQRPFMVVKHPLSGVRRVDQFALEPGRMCVMLSRHQVGCIIVTRDGVGESLDRYDHDSGARPVSAEDTAWNGYRAHLQLWRKLEASKRIVHASHQ